MQAFPSTISNESAPSSRRVTGEELTFELSGAFWSQHSQLGKNECFVPEERFEWPTNISSRIYYLEGRKSLFLILLIRNWVIKMTLLMMDSLLWKSIQFMY